MVQFTPYQHALRCEENAAHSQMPEDKLSLLIEGAVKISPRNSGDYDAIESEKIEEYIKCADLWKKAGELLEKSSISSEKLFSYSFQMGEFVQFPLAFASTCYANAGKALLSATRQKKIKEKNAQWNQLDEQALKLFKRALWADKGIETEKFHPDHLAAFQERRMQMLFSQLSLLEMGDGDLINVQNKIYKNALTLYEQYTQIAENKQKEEQRDWRIEIKRAICLKNAAFSKPKDSQEYRKLLLQAEKIAKDIWENCENCTSYSEFSREQSNCVEYTLLGDIKIALGHCTINPFFASSLVTLDEG